VIKPRNPNGADADRPAEYRILVRGHLGERWRDRLGGLEMTFHEDPDKLPQTELTGPLQDQAALMGVLEHLYSRGVAILSVERLHRRMETDP